MALSEFDLIDRYFRRSGAARADVLLGVGDDAALLKCPPGMTLVAAVDTLVDGVHFPRGCRADSVGHRALAVNLSDLAAMGAQPAWALLTLTLPAVETEWLEGFAAAFNTLALRYGVTLVGGDTTQGPLAISVTLLGWVPAGDALRRSGAAPGDALFVSGTPGDAAAGLALEQGRLAAEVAGESLRERFLFPEPRVALGTRLRGYASACIDVSDGLLADALKLARASGCGVELEALRLPLSAPLRALGPERARSFALTGGDDYELCFTVPPPQLERLEADLPSAQWGYTRIGTVGLEAGARVRDENGVQSVAAPGYDHFAAP
ncbi:MAG: thiamine-phosphate kinase [Steroidobacteraceae bacterium]